MTKIKLIYPFKDDNIMLPDFKITHWVPVIFPPCRNSYFISKDVVHSFNDEIRETLLKEFKHEVISVYDTCGYNPLLFVIETFSLDKFQRAIDSIRDQGKDLSPKFMSFTTSPRSILKRFGVNVGTESIHGLEELSKKQNELLDAINENPFFLDILEYIVYKDYEKYKGDIFEDYESISNTEYLEEKNKVEGNVNNFIRNIQNTDVKELMNDVAEFHKYEGNKFAGKEDEFMSVVSDLEKLKQFIYFAPIVVPPILAMLFLRFPLKMKIEEIKKYISDKLLKEDNVVDIYKLFGGPNEYAIKVLAKNISDLDEFIHKNFYLKGIHTSTKLVLRVWKKEGWYSTPEQRFPPPQTKKLDNMDYKIMSIMDNHSKKLADLSKEQQTKVVMINLLNTTEDKTFTNDEIENKLEKLKKELIIMSSIKLDRDDWLKTLIFIKASRGKKSELGENINDLLLGVNNASFARKYYHVTGEFDFIIPLDCIGLATLRSKIENFGSKSKDMVDDIRIYFDLCENYMDGISSKYDLKSSHFAYMTALLPNSDNINDVNEKSPRFICYKYVYEEVMRKKNLPKMEFKCIKEYVTPTIEFRYESVVHVFIRFKILDKENFKTRLKQLENKPEQIKRGITLRTYRPIHDDNVVFCILTTSNFEKLFEFINEFDAYCSSILPNLIFSQKFFEPNIPAHIRCKPCVSESKKCRACEQYPLPRDKANIHTRDLGINDIGNCKIAIVQIKQKKDELENDKRCVIEKLEEAIDNKSNIIIFPELTIPDVFINEIKNVMKAKYTEGKVNKRLFVVAGSRYKIEHKCKYDVSPVLYLNEEGNIKVYDDNYRNYLSHHDDEKNFKQGNNGIWRYINTGFGNFAVINCIDFIADNNRILGNLLKEENRCDILIVIARNYAMDVYQHNAEQEARKTNCAIAIANNGDAGFGDSRFYIPYRNDSFAEEKLKNDMMSDGEEGIIYHTIDLIELDKSRAIGKECLTNEEEKRLKEKYYCGTASQRGPIHSNAWLKTKRDQ